MFLYKYNPKIRKIQ